MSVAAVICDAAACGPMGGGQGKGWRVVAWDMESWSRGVQAGRRQARAGRLVNMPRVQWRSVGQPSQTGCGVGLRLVLQHALQRRPVLTMGLETTRRRLRPEQERCIRHAASGKLLLRRLFVRRVESSDMTRGSRSTA
jgi:hypothetical protein